MSNLQLYHNDMSSCSQKVRLVLEEKNLSWHGHHMNLRKGETRSKEYISKLNENGVVPTLIDGDQIIIESSIIMEYLDDAFPENSLKPKEAYNIALMRLWNKKIDEKLHSLIAVISSCIAFRHQFLEKYSIDEIKKLILLIPDKKRREISEDTIFNGLKSKFLPDAFNEYIKLFNSLDKHLSQNEWLAGDNYSLADASYTPYLTRFEHLNLSFLYKEKKFLSNWFSKVKKKNNFTKAILDWNNKEYLDLMKIRGDEAKSSINKMISI